MREHLHDEEETALPLMRAYYTKKEMKPFVMKIVERSPAVETGSLIHVVGVERWQKDFMRQEGIPFFVWYLVFRGKLRAYQKTFLHNVNALKNGVIKEQQQGWWRRWIIS
mmetsp:Transcript_3805/g.5681  ORF Transcript_3805/g.5681 Transcript_3805/m.5681 type:complete len:110 (-) Transcript_3805:18-347(-)